MRHFEPPRDIGHRSIVKGCIQPLNKFSVHKAHATSVLEYTANVTMFDIIFKIRNYPLTQETATFVNELGRKLDIIDTGKVYSEFRPRRKTRSENLIFPRRGR